MSVLFSLYTPSRNLFLAQEAVQKPFEAKQPIGRERLLELLSRIMIRAAKADLISIPPLYSKVPFRSLLHHTNCQLAGHGMVFLLPQLGLLGNPWIPFEWWKGSSHLFLMGAFPLWQFQNLQCYANLGYMSLIEA